MIRITTTEEASRTVIAIEGQLIRDAIDIVETCCADAEANCKPVHLYLRDVTIVDRDGQLALRRLAAKGVHLEAKGIYTSYLVEAATAGDGEQNGSCTQRRSTSDAAKQRRS